MMSGFLLSVLALLLAAPQKPQPLWVYQERSGIVCSPLVADLNNDGKLETVLLARGGEIACLGAGGALLWRVTSEEEFNCGPAILDLDGDGRLEVVAVDRGGKVLCLSGDGKVLWQYDLPGRTEWSSVTGARASEGGYVIVAQTDGAVACLGAAGNLLWEAKLPAGCFSLLALADVDGDGPSEAIIPCDYGFLSCLEPDGKVRWTVRPTKEGLAGPVCGDLDKDGRPEVLVGASDGTLFVLDAASGSTRWTFKAAGAIDASLAVADLEGDGSSEILFTAITKRTAYCLDAQGNKLWEFATQGRVPYAPAVADVDADGVQEVVLPDRDGFVYFLAPDGALKDQIRLDGGMNASPALADLDKDGYLEMVLATEAGKGYCFRLGKYQGAASLLWPMHRLDVAESGDATKARAAPQEAVLARAKAGEEHWRESRAWSAVGADSAFYLASNTALADVTNPDREPIRVILAVTDPRGVLYSTAVDSAEETIHLTFDFPVLANGDYCVEVTLRSLRDGAFLRRTSATVGPITLGAHDEGLVTYCLTRVTNALEKLRPAHPEEADNLEARVGLLRKHLARLQPDVRAFFQMSPEQQEQLASFAGQLRQQAGEWAAVAEYSANHFSAGKPLPFVVWQGDPWETLAPLARPTSAPVTEVKVVTLQNEWESVCLNLSNLTSRTRYVRVRPHPPAGEVKALPRDKVTIREVTQVAVEQKYGPPLIYADFLPEANEAFYFVLPPWESRQVWLTLDTRGLEPGEYVLPLVVAEVAPELSGETVNLMVRVRPVALPPSDTFQSCWWSYVWWDVHPSWAVYQAEHYVNLFPGVGIPLGEFDEQGNMVKPPDFTQVDAYVQLRRSAGPARFLFNEPFISPADAFDMEEVALVAGHLVEMKPRARRMYEQWLPLVVQHLKDIGLGYGDWAFYPIDEPSRGPTCLIASLSKAAKQIDSKVRFYIDFISGYDVYDLDLILPYIDFFCPQPDFGFQTKWGREMVRRIVAAGKETVCYGIVGVTSTWRPYRLMPWQCAKFGLTGAGGWVFIHQPYGAWPGDPTGVGDGHSANAGWETLYPSKRIEAYREGVEDYLYLHLLARLADRAEVAGLASEAAQARALRQEAINAVLAASRALEPNPGIALPESPAALAQRNAASNETIERYRTLLGDAIEALATRLASGQRVKGSDEWAVTSGQ